MIALDVLFLFLWLCLATLNYFAISRIIAKAGFSPWWVLCPITPLALGVILFLMLIVDAHTATSLEPGSLGAKIAGAVALTYLIGITTFLNWVLFLVFAFVKWPVQMAAESYGRRPPSTGPMFGPTFGPPPGQAPPPPPGFGAMPPVGSPSMAVPVPPAAGTVAVAQPTNGAEAIYADPLSVGVLTAEPPGPARPATIFCSWCGEERASDSHAIHYCGPTDRPAAYCVRCGTTFDGAPSCPSCGTSATELSKASRRR